MAGAHLDSWVAGDGAADDGAGVVIVMEAARILSQLGERPRRTIRFALWAGEEQGLVGSKAYLEAHFASRPPAPRSDSISEYYAWPTRFPVTKLADYDKLAAYFNVDNGSGKLRGVYAEGNFAAVPALKALLAPLSALGADHVAIQKTPSTDHALMASVGLPAFQFIQDPLDYESRVHHSNLDTFDHLKMEDIRQAAVVLASLLLETADRDAPLPRLPLPTRPTVTAPFAYVDPADEP
jgi:Zn-dependent M28 family amino/carboxypeptidase